MMKKNVSSRRGTTTVVESLGTSINRALEIRKRVFSGRVIRDKTGEMT